MPCVDGDAMAQDEDVVVQACDICYRTRSYRSFEFASFTARAPRLTALAATEVPVARDTLLAVGGVVVPTDGSLTVDGVELTPGSRPGGSRRLGGLRLLRRTPRVRSGACMGVVTGFAEIPQLATVEETVAHECELRRVCLSADELLELLAAFELATYADLRVEQLGAPARARLTAALAMAGAPRVALVDLTDTFAQGLTAREGADLMRLLRRLCHGEQQLCRTAVIVGTTEPSIAYEADEAFALDIDMEELMGAERVGRGSALRAEADGSFCVEPGSDARTACVVPGGSLSKEGDVR